MTIATVPTKVHRVEVHPAQGQPDPRAGSVMDQVHEAFGLAARVRTCRVYLIEAPLDDQMLQHIAQELLADPISQRPVVGASAPPGVDRGGGAVVEVHYKPGVMDPVAASTRDAIVEMVPNMQWDLVQVRTGTRYDILNTDASVEVVRRFAERALANSVIEQIHTRPLWPAALPKPHQYDLNVVRVPIRGIDDIQLAKLSRESHLFLSVDEMRAVREYFEMTSTSGNGDEPTDVELETIAQTWSEHCVHKTLKARIQYRESDSLSSIPGLQPGQVEQRPGHSLNADGSITIENLLGSTIRAATFQLMKSEDLGDWCVSVFEDNAGIVRLDDEHGVCIKVETHNHPSAIEPYGGAATGIGGCMRDILGTGLAAQPIANTDVFCVANPDTTELPKGVIHPKRILQRVVDGVRDYGNRKGIPTVNGSVFFHEDYLGNPLVFAGCVGLIPLDKCFGSAQPGDRIIVLGGATGRDGIHGATFSSAQLTDTHGDEFAHAVQIGNAITQKKMMDVILAARDHDDGPLFHAITDCGAGGFSSAVGEMGEHVGARVTLETAPLKYAGLSYAEIWISEAQERMVLAVAPVQVEPLGELCASEDVTMCDLGEYGWMNGEGEPELLLTYQGSEVGRLSMQFLHDGLPTPTREARWTQPERVSKATRPASNVWSLEETLYGLLAHYNIASKHWIVRQYDHEVQGSSVVKPLVGPHQDGPSDAAVVRPKLSSNRAVAIGSGLQPLLADENLAEDADPYWMALASIDEAVRNVVCVGADPSRIALLDNFCWPSCEDPEQLGRLVRAAEACYDGALAYRSPYVSGKDSLNNQFTREDGHIVTIPSTLLITALGIVPDALHARTMEAKAPGNVLIVVGTTGDALGGSHYRLATGDVRQGNIPHVDLDLGPKAAVVVGSLISRGLITSAHDCSDGGLLVAAAEMAFAGRIGLELDLAGLPTTGLLDPATASFVETPSRYLLEISPAKLDAAIRQLRDAGVSFGQVGTFANHNRLILRTPADGQLLNEPLDQLRQAWQQPLDW